MALNLVTSEQWRQEWGDRVEEEEVHVAMEPVRLAGNVFGHTLQQAEQVKQVEDVVYLNPFQ